MIPLTSEFKGIKRFQRLGPFAFQSAAYSLRLKVSVTAKDAVICGDSSIAVSRRPLDRLDHPPPNYAESRVAPALPAMVRHRHRARHRLR